MSVDTVPVPAPTDTSAEQAGGPAGSVAAPSTGGDAANTTQAGDGASGNASNQFTMRALVSSREAGIIIGKAGKNVADLREATGVKAGVSKVVPGVQERVLSVTGSLEAVGKAYTSILQNVAENPTPQNEQASIAPTASIKLLVANALMGSVIGKAGATIQALQAKHSSKIITVKEMLPNSTERIVSVEGSLASVEGTVQELLKIISEQDHTRLQNHIQYQPGSAAGGTGVGASGFGGSSFGTGRPFVAGAGMGGNRRYGQNSNNNSGGVRTVSGGAHASSAVPTPSNPDLRTQNISIPADMVGCIIGRGGTKINEIRAKSGAKISIAKDAHDESGERMFTITGPSEALEQALFLLYGQLEGEKEKRIQNQRQEQDA